MLVQLIGGNYHKEFREVDRKGYELKIPMISEPTYTLDNMQDETEFSMKTSTYSYYKSVCGRMFGIYNPFLSDGDIKITETYQVDDCKYCNRKARTHITDSVTTQETQEYYLCDHHVRILKKQYLINDVLFFESRWVGEENYNSRMKEIYIVVRNRVRQVYKIRFILSDGYIASTKDIRSVLRFEKEKHMRKLKRGVPFNIESSVEIKKEEKPPIPEYKKSEIKKGTALRDCYICDKFKRTTLMSNHLPICADCLREYGG